MEKSDLQLTCNRMLKSKSFEIKVDDLSITEGSTKVSCTLLKNGAFVDHSTISLYRNGEAQQINEFEEAVLLYVAKAENGRL